MKKYKLKAKLTHNGNITNYEDDVFFTDMIPSVLNSKTLSNITSEKDKLKELTGGVIIYDTNLEKENYNIDIKENEITVKNLNSDGGVQITGINGHVGSICLTTKQNVLHHEELKIDNACLEEYDAFFDEISNDKIKRFYLVGNVDFDEYSQNTYTKSDVKIGYSEKTITNNYATLDDYWKKFTLDEVIEEKKDLINISSEISEFINNKIEERNHKWEQISLASEDTPNYGYLRRNRFELYHTSYCYQDNENYYILFNYSYIYPTAIAATYSAYETTREEYLNACIQKANELGENPICYIQNKESGLFPSGFTTFKLLNDNATIDIHNINILAIKNKYNNDDKIQIIELNNIPQYNSFNVTKTEFDGKNIKYGSGLPTATDRNWPGYGISTSYRNYANFSKIEIVGVDNENIYLLDVKKSNIYGNDISQTLYSLNKSNKSISNLGEFTDDLKLMITEINSKQKVNRVVIDDGSDNPAYSYYRTFEIKDVHNMRQGGLNGGVYIFYKGVCSISNFDFDIEPNDTLYIKFEAGDFDDN